METFSALLAICAENSPVPGEFPTQRPVTRSFGVYFDLRPNKRLSKQVWGWWFETQSRPLWRHRNESICYYSGLERMVHSDNLHKKHICQISFLAYNYNDTYKGIVSCDTTYDFWKTMMAPRHENVFRISGPPWINFTSTA